MVFNASAMNKYGDTMETFPLMKGKVLLSSTIQYMKRLSQSTMGNPFNEPMSRMAEEFEHCLHGWKVIGPIGFQMIQGEQLPGSS